MREAAAEDGVRLGEDAGRDQLLRRKHARVAVVQAVVVQRREAAAEVDAAAEHAVDRAHHAFGKDLGDEGVRSGVVERLARVGCSLQRRLSLSGDLRLDDIP